MFNGFGSFDWDDGGQGTEDGRLRTESYLVVITSAC
jgi:hypothetical protein